MASISDSKTGMRNNGGIADLIVKGAIALVTAAIFIGAYLQFQVAFWLALIAALSVYITLLMLHTLMRRSERVDVLVSEVTRLEGELANVKGRPGEYVPPTRGAPRSGLGTPPPLRAEAKPPLSRAEARSAPPPVGAAPPSPPALEPSLQPPPPKPFATKAPEPAAAPHALSPSLPPWPNPPSAGSEQSVHDYWSFRPERPQAAEPRRGKKDLPPASPPAEGERETDLEAVQGMIKRLASEVSLGSTSPGAERSTPDNAMRASVDALYSTVDTMRAPTKKAAPALPRREGVAPGGMPPPIAPGHARLSSVAEAIAARRMDVSLDPIVGLGDHAVHHYEVSLQLRDEKGVALALAGQDRELARTGLLPLIDGARLKWAARMASSFAEQGQKYCMLSAASAESLTADRFLDELASAYRQRDALAGDLVLMFSQADVKAFGGTEWSALTDMRDLGFRFGLTDVTDLDYEFTALRAAGFAFAKLDATDLLRGVPGPGGRPMAAADISRYLGDLGLAVIVDQIDDEAARAAVVEAGVPLGKGPLFGAPVAVDTGRMGASGTAAA